MAHILGRASLKLLKYWLALMAFVGTTAAAAPKTASSKVLMIPTTTKLKLVSGTGSATLGDTLGKYDVTVIQFWASWCVGCGEMMSELAKRTKVDSSVGYASVSIDEDLATAQRYFKSKPADVKAAIPNALLDEEGNKIASPLKITTLPYVLVATKDGRVRESVAGHPKPAELTAMIARARASLNDVPLK